MDIFESDATITLLADLPGVKPEDLSVDLKEDVLSISACSTPSEKNNETGLLKKHEEGLYYHQFALTQETDQKKNDAQLSDGALSLTMHKVEKTVHHKIEVKTG